MGVPFEHLKGNKNQKTFQSRFPLGQWFLNINAILIAEECILEKLWPVWVLESINLKRKEAFEKSEIMHLSHPN